MWWIVHDEKKKAEAPCDLSFIAFKFARIGGADDPFRLGMPPSAVQLILVTP